MAEAALTVPPTRVRMTRRSRLHGLAAAAALVLGGAILAPGAAQAAEQPSFTADVTEVADERIDIAIEGEGFGDVQALPGQTEPHVYFTLVEQGADLSEISDTDAAVSASVAADGAVGAVLTVPAEELTDGTSYEVISWPSRSFPTESNLYARADITIDWAVLFPSEEEEPAEEEPVEEEPGEEEPVEEEPGEEEPSEEAPGEEAPAPEPVDTGETDETGEAGAGDADDGDTGDGDTAAPGTDDRAGELAATGGSPGEMLLPVAGLLALLGTALLVANRRAAASSQR